MATRTWNAGAWSDTANWTGGTKPTAADDVVVTASGGVFDIDVSNAVCRSISWAAAAGQTIILIFDTGSVLTIGTSTVNGTTALTMPSGSVAISDSGGSIVFVSTSGTAINISDSGAGNWPAMTFNGAGGSWKFNTTFVCLSITLTAGTLDLNGKTVTTGTFSSSGTGTRTLTMGAATFNINSSGTAWNTTTTTNLTFTPATSTVDFTYTNDTTIVTMQSGGLTFNNITSDALSLTVAGAPTCANFRVNSVATSSFPLQVVTFAGNITCTTNFRANGTSPMAYRPLIQSSVLGTQRTINVGVVSPGTAGTMNISDVNFCDMNIVNLRNTTTAYTGIRLGDCGGNATNNSGGGNIVFTTGANIFWTGNTGNWSDFTNHWALSSSNGSPGSGRVPLPQDTAIFDAGSLSSGSVVTIDNDSILPAITTTGIDQFLLFTSSASTQWKFYGNITLALGTSMTPDFSISIRARSTITWTSNGTSVTFADETSTFGVAAIGGGITFADAFTLVGRMIITNGTVTATGVALTASTVQDSGTATKALVLGTSLTLTSSSTAAIFSVEGTGTTLTTNTCIVNITGTAFARTFACANKTWGNLTISSGGAGDITIQTSSAATFGRVTIAPATNTVWTAGSTYTVTDMIMNGLTGFFGISISSSSSGSAFTFSKTSGIVICDFLTIKDSTASGGASFYAGGNSTSTSGNTGWVFTKKPWYNPANVVQGMPAQKVRQAIGRSSVR